MGGWDGMGMLSRSTHCIDSTKAVFLCLLCSLLLTSGIVCGAIWMFILSQFP
jgi:hypothetical protein